MIPEVPRGLGGKRLVVGCVAALTLSCLAVGGGGLGAAVANAEGVPRDGYSLSLVADGIGEPDALREAPDGRLFLLQQTGKVRIVQHGRLLRHPALVMDPANLVSLKNSAGLISIAFPPGFADAAHKRVYLLYTHTATADYPYVHNVVSRWTIDGNVIDPTSEKIVIHLDPLVTDTGGFATSHYGGDMEFGPDGKLYVTAGDLYVASNGQRLDTRNGKVLRYNRDGSIPHSNPFYRTLTGENRSIWDYGFRNPFHMAKDPKTGRLLLGDVGSSRFEEVNVLQPGESGKNYGWALAEGYTTDPALVSPVTAYPHVSTGSDYFGCASIGGDVYRPANPTFPRLNGQFLFADFCQGWLRSVNPRTGDLGHPLVTGLNSPVDVAVTANGSAWILQRHMTETGPGGLLRLDYVGVPTAPSITTQPTDATSAIHGSATFTVFASGSQPLTYQWYRDGTLIDGATSPTYSVNSLLSTDNGATFTVRVTNSLGFVDSRQALLTVTPNNQPDPVITTPMVGDLFAAGDTLHLSGTATDTEDGELPASAFTWDVDLHHNTHTHDIMEPVSGVRDLDVELPRDAEVDIDIFYRVSLSVTDSDGATTTITTDVMPELTSFSADTEPSGLGLDLDGVATTTPLDVPSVVGTTRSLAAAPVVVDADGVTWTFDGWSDGVTSTTRTFEADADPQTYLAIYHSDPPLSPFS